MKFKQEYLRPHRWSWRFMIGRFTMHAFLKEKYNERENSMQHDPDQVIDHDECTGPTLALSLRRISILGLYLGFALCLLGLWLNRVDSNWLFSSQAIYWINTFVNTQQPLLFIVPLAVSIICYSILHFVTNETLNVPERYLDERQRQIRDWAHRRAYQIIKPLLLIVLLVFAFQSILQPPQPQNTTIVTYVTNIAHPAKDLKKPQASEKKLA